MPDPPTRLGWDLPGGIVTFVLTDVEGSTALREQAPDAMRAALARHDLPPHATLDDLGTHRLKDLTRPERVFQLAAPDLPSVLRPLISLDARPHNLPVQTTSLIGREQIVAALLTPPRRRGAHT